MSKKRKVDDLLDHDRSQLEATHLTSAADNDVNVDGPVLLPSPVLGHILDYLPYDEVRQALLVGKTISLRASRHITTLNLLSPSNLDVPTARRFPSIETVNVLAVLLAGPRQAVTFRQDAATRTIPFLSAFPKLKRVFVGGMRRSVANPTDTRYRYYSVTAMTGPGDHLQLYRGLIDSFVGAFRSRMLGRGVTDVGGLTHALYSVRPCRTLGRGLGDNDNGGGGGGGGWDGDDEEDEDNENEDGGAAGPPGGPMGPMGQVPVGGGGHGAGAGAGQQGAGHGQVGNGANGGNGGNEPRPPHGCQWCRDLCSYLPVRSIQALSSGDVCLTDPQRYAIIRSRPGGLDCMKADSGRIFVSLLRRSVQFHHVPYTTDEDDVDAEFWTRMVEMGAIADVPTTGGGRSPPPNETLDVQYLSGRSLAVIDAYMDYGFDPARVPIDFLYRELGVGITARRRNGQGALYRPYDLWTRATVEGLMRRGFALDLTRLMVIDVDREPVLQRLLDQQHQRQMESVDEDVDMAVDVALHMDMG